MTHASHVIRRHLLLIHCAMLLVFVLGVGCGGADKKTKTWVLPGQTDFRVSVVDLQGVDEFSASDIRAGLVTKEDPGWRGDISSVPILGSERKYFNYVEWDRDLERIKTFYKERGYFGVQIISKNVVQNDQEKTVRLSVKIREGEPTKFTKLEILGLDDSGVNMARLRAKLPVLVGDRFSQARYLRAKKDIVRRLKRRSFAYAQVRGRVTVDPSTATAEVVFFVDPGPKCIFGPVRIEGLETIDPKYVLTAVAFQEGAPYDPDKVDETQDEIYQLRAFSVVKIITEQEIQALESASDSDEVNPDAPEEGLGISSLLSQAQESAEARSGLNPVVPVIIRVKEAKTWNLRVGASAEAEVKYQSVLARADWSNPNFLGGLQRIEHLNSIGYAWAPSIVDPLNKGLTIDSDLRFTKPQFFERLTKLKVRLRFQREVYQGYKQSSPSFRIGLEREFFNHLTLGVSYNFSSNTLSEVDESLIDSDVFVEDYVLEYLEQVIRLDYRDSILNSRKGFMLEVLFQEASSYFGVGERDYLKVLAALEMYFPLDLGATKHVLGLRGRIGSIYAIGAGKSVPVSEKLYGGGIDSMRSFGRQEVSYYTATGDALPIGAITQIDLSVESRWQIARRFLDVGDLWLAAFLDAASVADQQLIFDSTANIGGTVGLSQMFGTLLYGVGLGVFWETPVGPIRLDFAYTLSDISNDARFRRCSDGSQTCEPDGWVPESEDAIQDRITGYNLYIGIGHSF